MNLQVGCDRSEQVSSGTSWTTVSILSRQTGSPGFRGQGPGPQTSRGSFLHWNDQNDQNYLKWIIF